MDRWDIWFLVCALICVGIAHFMVTLSAYFTPIALLWIIIVIPEIGDVADGQEK